MIEIDNVTKVFDDIRALSGVSLEIQDNAIYGLVGTNGAGKSTLMRIMSGILRENEGSLLIDGDRVYNNVEVKKNIFFIPDDAYYFPNAAPKDMCRYYKRFYPDFDVDYYYHLLDNFQLPAERKLVSFSKGMKKQVSIVCALAAKTKYVFCDETFDGLDPVMRQGVKSLLAST